MSRICSICNKTFTRTSNLTEHFKLQHKTSGEDESNNGLPKKNCTEKSCKSSFRQASNFVVHFKKKHLRSCRCTGKLCIKCGKQLSAAKSKWRIMSSVPNYTSNCVVSVCLLAQRIVTTEFVFQIDELSKKQFGLSRNANGNTYRSVESSLLLFVRFSNERPNVRHCFPSHHSNRSCKLLIVASFHSFHS